MTKRFMQTVLRRWLILSKKHGMEMFQKGDQAHLNAMNEMRELMKTPDAMKDWFENKRKEFEALPEG